MDESDGHVPGGKPEEISRLITLGFFWDTLFRYPGVWETMRKKSGEEKVGFREGRYCEVLVILKFHWCFKKGKKRKSCKGEEQ